MAKLRNVTVTLDERTARWARVEAARRDTSVSKLIGEMLRDHMRRDTAYEAAMSRYLTRAPERLRGPGETYPPRDALYERDSLR
jgi:hypothetical protein